MSDSLCPKCFHYMDECVCEKSTIKKETFDHRHYHIGESNYSAKKIQPWDIWLEYDLNPWDADIVKRILRTKEVEGKSPAEARQLDYEKIIHICRERLAQIQIGKL